jgi:cytidyltransferase-like protein
MITKSVLVSGGFDNVGAHQLRFLEEASKLGELTVLLWSDEVIERQTGRSPKFPLVERSYFLNAVRYVARVSLWAHTSGIDSLAQMTGPLPDGWVDEEITANEARRDYCRQHGIEYHVIAASQLAGCPPPLSKPPSSDRRKVVVTGCYDWFHSGHVRFFEEVSVYGDLYVIVGHDANIRLLKGEGHPLIPETERRYVVGSIKYVTQALISSGEGWLDADPEIKRLKPNLYAVNEDGDKGGKREYCAKLGLQYLVLKRTPAPGLPRRSSTDLRGF